jgi:hypothetical protein
MSDDAQSTLNRDQVAKTIYATWFDADFITENHFRWFDAGKDNPDSCVHYSNVAKAYKVADAVLAVASQPSQNVTASADGGPGSVRTDQNADLNAPATSLSRCSAGNATALWQARYVLRNLDKERPGCGYGKLADACRDAADALTPTEPQTVSVTQNAAALTERLIQASVDYEAGRCSKREMAEARAAVEAAIQP